MNTPVSFEIAKLLKEKGFDVKNRTQYQMYGTQNIPQLEPYNDTKWNIYKDYYSAPTIADVAMWLYEKHGIWISVDLIDDSTIFRHSFSNIDFKSPTEAYEAAIDYTLNNLI
jgi:hypothetical protein